MDTTKDSYKVDPSMEELDQEDEAEETLSFCDLPIYSHAAEWENFSKEDRSLSSSSSSSNQDFFEFFSEDWSTSSAYPVQNIVFCGKLIPFKEPNSDTELTHKLESSKQEKPRKHGLSQWNSKLFSSLRRSSKSTNPKRIRCVSSSKKSLSLPVSPDKYGYKVAKGGERYGYSVRRASIMALPANPRWYLLMFGLARMPSEMEPSDIKSRQGRQSRSALVQPSGGGGGGGEKVRGGKGLWGAWWLIRALGCGSHHQYDTTTAMQTPP